MCTLGTTLRYLYLIKLSCAWEPLLKLSNFPSTCKLLAYLPLTATGCARLLTSQCNYM